MTDTQPAPTPTPGSSTVAVSDFGIDTVDLSFSEVLRDYAVRVKGGQVGSLPGIIGLTAIFLIFTVAKGGTFLSVYNFSNLIQQAAWMVILAMGVSFVLMLGEIDLAAGATMGVTASIIFTRIKADWPVPLAVLLGFAVGITLGLITGVLVAKVGIPSFVVTLALFLAWQGLTLKIAKEGGSIDVPDGSVLQALNARNMKPVISWIIALGALLIYAVYSVSKVASRKRRGAHSDPYSVVGVKVGILSLVTIVATLLLNRNRALAATAKPLRGMPYIVPVIFVLLSLLTVALNRTRWGRHLYAVGGNAEAARRAGINVTRIKVSAFVLTGFLATIAGLAYVSKVGSVTPQTGSGDELLRAVGAAVVGGTSLFGGRGKMTNALIGGFVLASIDNGLGLISKVGPFEVDAGFKFVVTGLVLLVFGSIDALTRRRSAAG